MRKAIVALGILAASCGRQAFAQAKQDDPAQICLKAAVEEVVGASQHATVPNVRGEYDGPIPVGNKSLRGYADVELSGLPGQNSVNPLDITTVHSFSGTVGAYYEIGHTNPGSQAIITGVAAQYGFSTSVDSTGALLSRNPRTWGAGFIFREKNSEGYLRILYGRDESSSTGFGFGQLLFSSEIPFTGTKAVWFGVDGVLNVGHPLDVQQVDRVQIYLGFAVPELVSVIGKTTATPPAAAPSAAFDWHERHAPPSNQAAQ
jgi:hypothetical protein